jgi:hypothetical protein
MSIPSLVAQVFSTVQPGDCGAMKRYKPVTAVFSDIMARLKCLAIQLQAGLL